jgi:hypothetical protein
METREQFQRLPKLWLTSSEHQTIAKSKVNVELAFRRGGVDGLVHGGDGYGQ